MNVSVQGWPDHVRAGREIRHRGPDASDHGMFAHSILGEVAIAGMRLD